MNAVNTLKNNAYHVLGLDTEADRQKIQQRANEIRNRLKIDDLPEYDLDPGVFEGFRTEGSVKDAIQKLGAPRGRIKECFFWFQVTDDVDERALKLLKDKDYSGSIEVWKNAIETGRGVAYFYKKNLAVLYSLMLSVRDNKNILGDSLLLWKELVESSGFWNAFSLRYLLYNEQTANEALIDEFRKQAPGHLSDMYTELYLVHRKPGYIGRFLKTFSVTGELMVRDVLEPALIAINDMVEELGKTEINSETVVARQDKRINEYVSKIQSEFDRLKDLGLYDDSRTKVLRDKAATEIRRIGIDFYNKLSDTERSMSLIQAALKIVGTSGLEDKIKGDIKTLKEIVRKEAPARSVPKYRETAPPALPEDAKLRKRGKFIIGCIVSIIVTYFLIMTIIFMFSNK